MLRNLVSNASFHRRNTYETLKLKSYISVCVDVGQIHRAFNILIRYSNPKTIRPIVDVNTYNVVLKAWAQLGAVNEIAETRLHMIRNGIEPNSETYAYMLLGYTKGPFKDKGYAKKLVYEMRGKSIDPKTIFQVGYLNPVQRKSIRTLLKVIIPKYEDAFYSEPTDYKCKLLSTIKQVEPVTYNFAGNHSLENLSSWAELQRQVEWKSSIIVKSVCDEEENIIKNSRYIKAWEKLHDMWKKGLEKSLKENLDILQAQSATGDKIHLYPYLCSVDKSMLIHLMLDEIENNASFANYSVSTNHLHLQLGTKVMLRYLRSKSLRDGSHSEIQKLYNLYLEEYCAKPKVMSKWNPREFFQHKARELKIYAIYKDRYSPVEEWPHHIVTAVGKFLYGIILKEAKFDPELMKSGKREIKQENLVHAFYTAYFQINYSHKIKEEFRAHKEFENFYMKACGGRLKFDYSFLPLQCPPMPWLSHGLGGYLTNKSSLVRVASPFAEQTLSMKHTHTDNQKLYPSLDSLNALGLVPWIVNREILDLVIDLFRAGGDAELKIPLHASKMDSTAPILKENSNRPEKIAYNREKKKHDQKRREMYSLWCDCHYRLSIANHFRNRILWFPHNMDFRGRTYPIPPHFNHLGADLARSLLLFARGLPLGERGLDWLKLHLINLVGNMKKSSLHERLDYANSILHSEVLDSADNPWNGRRWWTKNENPWQVLACCKEIAKAIRSQDFRQYISHFPVHQDGSCNGLQHYAALGRDFEGASSVNLVPCDKPQDVYTRVLEIVEETRQKDAERGNNVAIMLQGVVNRKVIKQTVMTTVYGVTMFGAMHQIMRQLTAKGYPEKEIRRAAVYLAGQTFESIGKMFNKSRLIQDWLNHCAYIIASRYRQPVCWETPLGFPVAQPYTVPKAKSTNRLISSAIGLNQVLYNDPLGRIDAPKQKTAFPPNYIHSLDSSHMMLTSLFCQKKGLTYVSVHDCYWTHACKVDIMNRICREQFVALHSEPLLKQLAEQFKENYGSLIKDEATIGSGDVGGSTSHEGSLATPAPAGIENMSGYNDRLVEEDLELLLASDTISRSTTLNSTDLTAQFPDQKLAKNTSCKPLKKLYDIAHKAEKEKLRATFNEVPESGNLDLKLVLDSVYFFS